jgi:starch-binding outer membrane protein, SusD/RagB family
MKKTINTWLLAGATLALVTACDGRLEVAPTQSIDENSALSTAQDVEVTLVGAFDGLSSANLYGGAFQYSGELLGDDAEVRFAGTFSTLDELWRKTVTTTNTQTQATWLSAYSTINRANNVLSALDKVGASDKNRIEGSARLIRGMMYFELVRLWAKAWGDGDANSNPGVPLVTTPTRAVTDQDSRPRATVAAIYAQVLEDFTKAESLLPATTSSSNFSFATRNAASAMLARVYLQQSNYAAARDAANRVIGSNVHSLTAKFEDAFKDASNRSEILFRVFVNEQDGTNSMNTFFAPSTFQGRGDIRVQAKHLALYGTTDVRGQFFVRASNNTFTGKFLDQFGDVPIIRLAEMYLIRAEGNQRLNTTTGATPLADVNRIRARAGAAALTAATVDAIIAERKLELAFEGHQVHDAKRLQRSVTSTIPFNSTKLVLPIPQREIDTNKSLVQNPGY